MDNTHGRCIPCKTVFRWRGRPLLRDALCPRCKKPLARTAAALVKKDPIVVGAPATRPPTMPTPTPPQQFVIMHALTGEFLDDTLGDGVWTWTKEVDHATKFSAEAAARTAPDASRRNAQIITLEDAWRIT